MSTDRAQDVTHEAGYAIDVYSAHLFNARGEFITPTLAQAALALRAALAESAK